MKAIKHSVIIGLVVLFSCGMSLAALSIGQPGLLVHRPLMGPSAWPQTNQAIAGLGDMYLAAWLDGQDLYAARISANGRILDRPSIRLTANGAVLGKPAIARGGDAFFVVYAAESGVGSSNIYGQRISPEGVVLDPEPMLITAAPPWMPPTWKVSWSSPSVSFDGTNYIVVFELVSESVPHAGPGIYVSAVSQAGNLISPYPRSVGSFNAPKGRDPVAASADGRTLVMWTDTTMPTTRIVGTTVTTLGHVISPTITVGAEDGSQQNPACTWAGDHFKVVWSSEVLETVGGRRVPVRTCIKGTRVSVAGKLLDPSPWLVSDTPGSSTIQDWPEIASRGTDSLVTWKRAGDIYASRVDGLGNVLDGAGYPLCAAEGIQTSPAIAPSAGGYMACWLDSRTDVYPLSTGFGFHVRGVRLGPNGIPIEPEFPFALSASYQRSASAADNGRVRLIVWEEWRDGQWLVCGGLMHGEPDVPGAHQPFVIGTSSGHKAAPSVIWNGAQFVVVWLDKTSLLAARVTPRGDVLDPASILIGDNVDVEFEALPALATDGSRTFVGFITSGFVHAAIMDRDGVVRSHSILGQSGDAYCYQGVGACWTGQCYVIVWKKLAKRTPSGLEGGFSYTTVSRNGIPTRPKPVDVLDSTFPDYFAMACNGSNVLLASYGPEIRTRRFGLDGTLIDDMPLTIPGSFDAEACQVSWDGTNYLITWTTAKQIDNLPQWQNDIRAIRVSADNALVDLEPFDLLSTPSSEYWPTQCAGPDGRTLILFSGWWSEPYGAMRGTGLFFNDWLDPMPSAKR